MKIEPTISDQELQRLHYIVNNYPDPSDYGFKDKKDLWQWAFHVLQIAHRAIVAIEEDK